MDIILDFKNIDSKESLHAYLQKQLHLPENYGRNLDALHDCLSEKQKPFCIQNNHFEQLKAALGDYADTLLEVLKTNS